MIRAPVRGVGGEARGRGWRVICQDALRMMKPLWKTVWRFLKKRKLPRANNPTPGHLSGENQDSKRSCTPMFTAALSTIAKTWKAPKCPLTEEWIKKVWYMYTMEYYSAIKKSEIMAFAATWMDLEITILGDICQTVRDKHHIISLVCGI